MDTAAHAARRRPATCRHSQAAASSTVLWHTGDAWPELRGNFTARVISDQDPLPSSDACCIAATEGYVHAGVLLLPGPWMAITCWPSCCRLLPWASLQCPRHRCCRRRPCASALPSVAWAVPWLGRRRWQPAHGGRAAQRGAMLRPDCRFDAAGSHNKRASGAAALQQTLGRVPARAAHLAPPQTRSCW